VISDAADDAAECEAVPGCVHPAGDCVSRRGGKEAAKDDVVRDLAELGAHAVGVVGHPLQGTVQRQRWYLAGGHRTLGPVKEGLDVVLGRGSGGLRDAGERACEPRTAELKRFDRTAVGGTGRDRSWCVHDKVGAGTSGRIARRARPRLWATVQNENSDERAGRLPEDN
jgi:hypothetical protein